MIAITPKGERWYTPESEAAVVAAAAAENPPRTVTPTRFKIRDLTQRVRVMIMDSIRISAGDGDMISTSIGSRTHLALKAGLVGVENFPDGHGNDVAFELDADGEVADSFLERIPWPEQRELGAEILSGSVMSEDEVEKPEPSPEA